jgi:hypothetical protein
MHAQADGGGQLIGFHHQGRQAGGQAVGFMLQHGKLGQTGLK